MSWEFRTLFLPRCCTGLRVRVTPECLGGDSGPLIRPMLARHKAGG